MPDDPKAARAQFLVVLRLVPRLHDPAAWQEEDRLAVSRHFDRLKAATEQGNVILAGRTDESFQHTFGLIVFEAEDEAAARAFMLADPAVMANVMTAELHPYVVSLLRDSPTSC